MQYLAWRVITGLHKSITISFLLVGHTKFAPDWCFGLLKQRFRKTKVDCLDDIAEVVKSSAEVNKVQLVATQDGQSLVPTYDWSGFFDEPFKQTALKGITGFHQFRFTSDCPGHVFVKSASNQPEKEIHLLADPHWSPRADELPPILDLVGLSEERQVYLYEKIREFCRPEVQDFVYPRLEGYTISEEGPVQVTESQPPPAKKPRKCSHCKQSGHNIRRRPQLK